MAIDDNTSYELTGAQVKDLASKINAKADSSSLATVAPSGSYNDLLDKPTIPTVNDGTLTIQHNGTTKGTFTANQSAASTVNIETIYADTPGTATTPAASVQASDIVWSTMPFNYSTTEIDTGCTWIDGSHIYRKTVDISSLPNATSKSVANGISNLNNVVRVEGFAKDSNGVRITLPFASVANIADQIAIRVETSNIVIITGVNRSGFSGYVTLWYTKTS